MLRKDSLFLKGMNDREVLQAQFDGFQSTPLLWSNNAVMGLIQFQFGNNSPIESLTTITKTPRLGKLVEQFVNHSMARSKTYNILIQNAQIQRDKITLGELDCIFKSNEDIIHLEIIYKFYLYDNAAGESELDKWIGPNKKDSLNQKLTKLITKQLPRLHLPETKEILTEHNLNVEDIIQRVHFRAQLFIPYTSEEIIFDAINKDCVAGFYVNHKELEQFSKNTFFLPQKLDWLATPSEHNGYIDLTTFKKSIESYVKDERSPLCWMKTPQNKYQKLFVVWW